MKELKELDEVLADCRAEMAKGRLLNEAGRWPLLKDATEAMIFALEPMFAETDKA